MKLDTCQNCKHKQDIIDDKIKQIIEKCGRTIHLRPIKNEHIKCCYHEFNDELRLAINKYEKY